MKLQHFAIGERFEYEGQTFVKTGPLTGSSEAGEQQLIPRHATLNPIATAPSEISARAQLTEAKVRNAFDHFYQTSERLTDSAGRAELETARAEFFAALK